MFIPVTRRARRARHAIIARTKRMPATPAFTEHAEYPLHRYGADCGSEILNIEPHSCHHDIIHRLWQ